MNDLPERERNYQAHVHFALGGVIQGLMLAALAGEVATVVRTFTYPDSIWIAFTALQSLMLCILFWYRFMDNFIFGFRVINLTAGSHYLFSVHHLLLGLLQFIAIRFLGDARTWLTLFVLLVITTQVFSYFSSNLQIIQQEGAIEALSYEPDTRYLVIFTVLAVLLLVLWYLLPGLESGLFKGITLTVSFVSILAFTDYSIKIFQRHLIWCHEN